MAVDVRQVISLHPKSAIEARSFCARECLLCNLTVRADYTCTRSAESSVLWFYLSFRTLLHSFSVGQFIDFRIKLKKWIMTQFNKGPAYGLSAEVKNKVNWTFISLFWIFIYVCVRFWYVWIRLSDVVCNTTIVSLFLIWFSLNLSFLFVCFLVFYSLCTI